MACSTAAQLGTPEEQKWRAADPERYLVLNGDFDGDGKPDQARLLVRGDGKAFALFVKLAAREAALKLDEFPDIKKLPAIGIKRVGPGEYPTACARGYDCAEDEPRYIRVTHRGNRLFSSRHRESLLLLERDAPRLRPGRHHRLTAGSRGSSLKFRLLYD